MLFKFIFCLLRFWKKNFFGRQKEERQRGLRERWNILSTSSLHKYLQHAELSQVKAWSQELKSGIPRGLWSRHQLPSTVCFGRKLESGVKPGPQVRHRLGDATIQNSISATLSNTTTQNLSSLSFTVCTTVNNTVFLCKFVFYVFNFTYSMLLRSKNLDLSAILISTVSLFSGIFCSSNALSLHCLQMFPDENIFNFIMLFQESLDFFMV